MVIIGSKTDHTSPDNYKFKWEVEMELRLDIFYTRNINNNKYAYGLYNINDCY